MSTSVKKLLAEWSVDNKSWRAAIKDIRDLLRQAEQEDKVRIAAQKSAQEASLAASKKELELRQTLNKHTKDSVTLESNKARAIKSTADIARTAASEQLSATKAITVAEKAKAEAAKAALEIQARAAKNALAFEKAYQAQVQDAAKAKAKAAAIFDAAYRAQVAEVQKVKKDRVRPQTPSAVYSSVPLITTAEKKIANVETQRQKVARTPVQVELPAKVDESVAIHVEAEKQINVLKAEQVALNTKIEEQETAIARRRSAITGKFIGKDSTEPVLVPGLPHDEQAAINRAKANARDIAEALRLEAQQTEELVQKMSLGIQEAIKAAAVEGHSIAQAEADYNAGILTEFKARLAEIKSEAAGLITNKLSVPPAAINQEALAANKLSEEEILKLKQQQAIVNARLQEQEAALARAKELAALKQDIVGRNDARLKQIAEERAAQEKLGEEIIALMRREEAEQRRVKQEERKEESQRHKEELEHRRKELEEQKEAAEKPSLRRLLRGPATTIAGGGKSALGRIAGSLVGGLEIGAGILAFEELEKGLDKIVDKVKEFVEDSGGLQKVTETFKNLSAGKGYDSGEFLEELQHKTQHLVSEVDLLRVANTFMQSGLKVSKEDMLELTEATVGLARGQGKDATTAVQALTRTFLTGGRGAMQLARVVGIQGPALMMRGFGSTTTMAERQQQTFENLAKVIKRRYEEMGQPAITYTDRLKQVQVVSTELYEKVAQGAVKSTGFATLMNSFGAAIEKMGGMEEVAERVGNTIGNLFAPLAAIFAAFLPTLSAVGKAFSDVATAIEKTIDAVLQNASPVDKLGSEFAKLHPILDLTIKLLSGVAAAAQFAAAGVSLAANVAGKYAASKNPSINSDEYNTWLQQKGYATYKEGESFAHNREATQAKIQHYDEFKKDWKAQDHSDGKSYKEIWTDFTNQVKDLDNTQKNTVQEFRVAYAHNEKINLGADSQNLKTAAGLPVILPEEKAKITEWEDKIAAAIPGRRKELDAKIEDIHKQQASGKLSEFVATEHATELRKNYDQQLLDLKQKTAKELNLKYTPPAVTPSTVFNDDQLNRRNAQRLAQETLANAQKRSKEALEDAKDNIAEETDANERLYKLGIEGAEAYYNKKKELAKETLDATLININEEQEAQKKQLKSQLALGNITPKDYQIKVNTIDLDSDRQRSAATKTYRASISKEKLANDLEESKIAKEGIQANLKYNLDAIDLEKDAVANAFRENRVSAQDYYDFQVAAVERTRDLNIDAIHAEIAENGALSDSNISLYTKIQELTNNAGKQIQDLNNTKIQIATQNIGERTTQAQSRLSALQESQNSPLSNATYSDQVQIQNDVIQTSIDAIAQYNEQLVEAARNGLAGSKTWNDIVVAIQQANNALDQQILKAQELKNEGTTVGQLAGLAAAGSSAFGNIFGGRYARGVENALGAGSEAAFSAQDNVNQMRSFGGIKSAIQKGSISDAFSDFTKGLKGAITAVGQFASAIANAGSASAGAFGGALAGGGLGNAVGSELGQKGGPLASLGAMAGPLGSLVGGALGAATGAIFGQKQEEVQDDINQLSANFKSIMNEFSTNNTSLTQTISNLTVLIAQAQAMQASTKKGGSQFTQLIQQYNEQIVQLENQQKQIMTQLNEQLAVATAPTAFQNIVSGIQQILQQYTEFVGAAQNANELAQANNYLTQSLENLAVTYSDQLNQGQQQAIQDALNLNDLYNQRNQLEYQYLQQVRSIQGEGTLTRGVTLAQSKFSKLYNLDVQQTNQLNAINAQINLEQYKVSAAQQIFSLATTQVGLQTQLLDLQKIGINEDMQRLNALQYTLQMLQNTGYSLTNLGSVNPSDPNALLTTLLSLLANQLGINVGGALNPSGAPYGLASDSLSNLAAGAYQQRAQFGFANYRSSGI